jgi:hypothetical protein
MNEQDFLLIANANPSQVNVWYTQTLPYTILGLTVPVKNNAGESIIGYLQQATSITLQVNEATNEYVTLTITSRSLLSAGDVQYYYFITSTVIIQDIGDALITPGQVIFTPGIDGLGFQQGGYNAILGEAEENRRSEYIMQADRISYINTGAGLPTNIEQLETNAATRAQVQDSLYSDTGWISGRYEGTKLSTLTNLGADPALQGTFFEGASFSINAEDTTIQGLAGAGALTYEQYFFTGTGFIPQCVLIKTGLSATADFASTTDQTLKLFIDGGVLRATQPNIGDILTFSTDPGARGEFYKMLPVNQQLYVDSYPYTFRSSTAVWAFVQRGYNSSPRSNTLGSAALYKISPVKIYTLSGTTIQPLKQGKLIVKGTDDVLYIDINGFVIGAVGGSTGNPVPTIIE